MLLNRINLLFLMLGAGLSLNSMVSLGADLPTRTVRPPINRIWAPFQPLEGIENLTFFQHKGKTWVSGRVKFPPHEKVFPFQLPFSESNEEWTEWKSNIAYPLCDGASCGLPYVIRLTKSGKYAYELTETMPATIPSNIADFKSLNGQFDPLERVSDATLYFLPADDSANISGKFSGGGLEIGKTYKFDIKMNANALAGGGVYHLVVNVDIPKIPLPFPSHPCQVVCNHHFEQTFHVPSTFLNHVVLQSPSGKRLDLYGGSGTSYSFSTPSPKPSTETGYSYARASLTIDAGFFLEEPVNGDWKLELSVEDGKKCPVSYTVGVNGAFTVTPLITPF